MKSFHADWTATIWLCLGVLVYMGLTATKGVV